jgi:hypothetical protein
VSFEFIDLARIHLVGEGVGHFSSLLESERLPRSVMATVVARVGEAGDSFLLLTDEDLESLLAGVRRGEDVRRLLQERDSALLTERGTPPDEAAVVVEDGAVVGAYVAVRASRGANLTAGQGRGGPIADRGGSTPVERSSSREHVAGEISKGERSHRGRRHGRGSRAPGSGAMPVPEPAADPTIRRTPHLDAPRSIPTKPGSTFEIVVRVDDRGFGPDEAGRNVEIKADVDWVECGVNLTVTGHFEVEGPPWQPLVIERDVERSAALSFTVRVVEDPPNRVAGVLAEFSYRGRPCGFVGRSWDWRNDRTEVGPADAKPAAAVSFPVDPHAERPDLSVTITAPVNDGEHYVCKVQTQLIPGYDPPVAQEFGLRSDAAKMVATLLEAITDADTTPAQRRLALTAVGYEFYDAAPRLFKEVLWKMVDAGRKPNSIYIASVEPTLPWELMIPTRRADGALEELRPLGVEFSVGRWTMEDNVSPVQRLRVRNAFIVAPDYPDHLRLDGGRELKILKERLRGQRVAPVTLDHLDAYFATHPASILHFVCHGEADLSDYDDMMHLEDGESLRARSLRGLKGFKELCKCGPLVFINACETGRTVPSLGGGGGFPRAFGFIGARAVIAPLWAVADDLADEIAVTVYERALERDAPPLAEILRAVRQTAYERDDSDTYAAYCFFGDPLTRLELVDA